MIRPDVSEIYECDERDHSVQGPVEACISECMIHNEGWKGGVILHETELLIVCVCLQITLEWAWAQSLRESATVQGYPTVSSTTTTQTALAPNHWDVLVSKQPWMHEAECRIFTDDLL